MPVVANISVLLAARVENYTSGIGFARKANEDFKKSAEAAGLSTRSAAQALGILRKEAFESLTTQQKYNEEVAALKHLLDAGIVTATDYGKALDRLNKAYNDAQSKERLATEKAIAAAQEKALALVRPQLEGQRKLRSEYQETLASLKALQGSDAAKNLGITDGQIANARKSLTRNFLAEVNGQETPESIFKRSKAAVDQFNQSAVTAKQRLRSAIAELRELKQQAAATNEVLDRESLRGRVEQIIDRYRKESGLNDQLAEKAKARKTAEELQAKERLAAETAFAAAQERGLALVRPQLESQRKLGEAYRENLASLKALQGSETAKKLGITDAQIANARKNLTRNFLAEAKGKESPEAVFNRSKAAVEQFNQSTVTAKQRLRAAINELRDLKQQAAATNQELNKDTLNARVAEIVERYRKESGLNDEVTEKIKIRKAAEEELQRSIERGLALADRRTAADRKIFAQLRDLRAAANANPSLDYEATASRLFNAYKAQQAGRETDDQRQARVRQENESAENNALNAFAQRAKAYQKLNQDITAGLSERAAAARKLQIEETYRQQRSVETAPKDALDASFIALQEKYNEAVRRGTAAANPAIEATQRYRDQMKDLSKALQKGAIDQDQYNRAALVARRNREDTSLDPIVQAGKDFATPYNTVAQSVVRNIENMREAVKAGVISQREMDRSGRVATSTNARLARTYQVLEQRAREGAISQKEFALAIQLARKELLGQSTILSRITSSLGVLKTVGTGLAGAQLYGGIFEGISSGFAFEKDVRFAIAQFRDADQEAQSALRSAVISATSNNDTSILDRVDVLKEIGRDAVSASTALQSLNDVLSFAATSGLDAGQAVSKVSEVIKAYRLETGEASQDSESLRQVMDLLQASSLQTASNVEEMAEALIRTAPQANQLGISLRSAATGAIALSEIGRKGDVGGNELAIALRDISNKAVENQEAFKALGVEVFDTDGGFVGLGLTIRSLANALAGLTAEQRTTALQQLGVTQKASQFQQQLISLVDVLDQAETNFIDTNGAVERIQGNLPELNKLTNKLQSGFTYLINTTVYRFLERVASAINSLSSETRTAIVVGTTFAGSFALFINYAPAIIGWMVKIRAVLITLTAAQQAHNTSMLISQALSGNWKQLAVSVLLAAAAAGTMYYAWTQMEKGFGGSGILEATENLERMQDAIQAGRTDLEGLQTLFNGAASGIGDSVASFLEGLKTDDAKAPYLERLQQLIDGISQSTENTNIENLSLAGQELDRLARSIEQFNDIDSNNVNLMAEQFKTVEYRVSRVRLALEEGAEALDNLNRLGSGQAGNSRMIAEIQQMAFDIQSSSETLRELGGAYGENLAAAVEGVTDRLSTASSQQLLQVRTQITDLYTAIDGYLRDPQQSQLLGGYDKVIDSMKEIYKILKDQEQLDFLGKQAEAYKSIMAELQTPFDKAVEKLEQLRSLKITLTPELESRYINKVLNDLESATNRGGDGNEIAKLNSEAAVRGSAQDYSIRNAAFFQSESEQRRRQHQELVGAVRGGNTRLDSVIEVLKAQRADANKQESVDPFDF